MISNLLGGVTAICVSLVLFLTWPTPSFITVESMTVSDGFVTVKRKILGPDTIADWRVSVVSAGGDTPSCQTRPGPEKHQGWSPYRETELQTKVLSLDEWVGDDGCYNRLPPGTYDMFVTWTPRDGRDPVAAKTQFEVKK